MKTIIPRNIKLYLGLGVAFLALVGGSIACRFGTGPGPITVSQAETQIAQLAKGMTETAYANSMPDSRDVTATLDASSAIETVIADQTAYAQTQYAPVSTIAAPNCEATISDLKNKMTAAYLTQIAPANTTTPTLTCIPPTATPGCVQPSLTPEQRATIEAVLSPTSPYQAPTAISTPVPIGQDNGNIWGVRVADYYLTPNSNLVNMINGLTGHIGEKPSRVEITDYNNTISVDYGSNKITVGGQNLFGQDNVPQATIDDLLRDVASAPNSQIERSYTARPLDFINAVQGKGKTLEQYAQSIIGSTGDPTLKGVNAQQLAAYIRNPTVSEIVFAYNTDNGYLLQIVHGSDAQGIRSIDRTIKANSKSIFDKWFADAGGIPPQ